MSSMLRELRKQKQKESSHGVMYSTYQTLCPSSKEKVKTINLIDTHFPHTFYVHIALK